MRYTPDQSSRWKRWYWLLSCYYSEYPLKIKFQGELLEMNVVNRLSNEDMIVGTSLVSAGFSFQEYKKIFNGFSSTGMEFFNIIPVLWMAQRVSLSVPLHRETHLCTSLAPSKLEHFGTTLISVSFLSAFPFVVRLYGWCLRRTILRWYPRRLGCLWSWRP